MTIVYPPGQISTWGQQQALANQLAWITYTGVDGSQFYLAGPHAPVPGAQDGIVLQKHMGLMSPFTTLQLEGARQDGATWTDTVYDVGEIMLSLEASGIAPQNIRNVLRQWISAWDPAVGNPGHPTQLGTLSVYTPDMGEWWANVRLGKNISDIFDKDFTYSGKQTLTWECKNFDAFWYGPDSVSTFNGNTVQFLNLTGNPSGSVTLGHGGLTSRAFDALSPASIVQKALDDIVGIGNAIVTELKRTLSAVIHGIEFVGNLAKTFVDTLIPGASGLFQGAAHIGRSIVSQLGFLGNMGAVAEWITGYIPITNIGDLPAWPRYLCYGPGSFAFGNGPGNGDFITFGPLLPGQIVLVTTEPRLRSVVDLTPGQTAPTQQFQNLLAQLISFATNNNVPPLLRRFESEFGIVPPQGNLFSLLNGRFTNPVPGSPYGVPPQTQYIPAGISGFDSNTKIIAAVTPMRRWPL